MATKTDVMVTLCGAFGVFSAFGAAILVFFPAGGGLQRISSWLVRREEARAASDSRAAGRKALLQGRLLVWLVVAIVTLTVIINGIGLFTSFFWLVAAGNGDAHQSAWAYQFAETMFYIEVVDISVITAVAVVASALAALPSPKTETSEHSPSRA